MDELRNKLARKAIILEVGGFRPPDDPLASWFGTVNMCAEGESWPEMDGEPMHALCQINVSELPFRPPRLEDIAFITVFIGPRELPFDSPNGQHWCLRAYKKISELVPLAQRQTDSAIRPFPMRSEAIIDDFPCKEDIDIALPKDVEENYYGRFETACGFKLGGWPRLIQAEIYWAPSNLHPASPEYVFQIDSTGKGNWSWGHDGVGYFGRGTACGKEDEWALEWQCY